LKPQKKAPALTPEEQAAYLAEQKLAAEEREKERQRVELYGKSVEKMSHRQLSAELRKTIRREHTGKPPQPQAGLTIALASILSIVFDNTKTTPVFETDKKGRPTRTARPDQINPNGRLHPYPL
jgi:hypothetical protein